jgi:hypothetical protein
MKQGKSDKEEEIDGEKKKVMGETKKVSFFFNLATCSDG